MQNRKLVILESPYRGHGESGGAIAVRTRLNVDYARQCLHNSILRGEAPIASHLLYTQPGVLDDTKPEERTMGIECGLAWLPVADYSIYYTDHGWSTGMLGALHEHSLRKDRPFKIRSLKGIKAIQLPSCLDPDIENLLQRMCQD